MVKYVAFTRKKRMVKSMSVEQGQITSAACVMNTVGHFTPSFIIIIIIKFDREKISLQLIKDKAIGAI